MSNDAFEAVKEGRLIQLQKAVEKGFNVNTRDPMYGNAPLHWAARNGHTMIIQWLLDHGADKDAVAKNGNTALHFAADAGNTTSAEVLLKAGLDPNAKSKFNYTPMHWAAAKGHLQTMQVLLKHGSDINAKDKDGLTPLHLVADKGYDHCLEWMVQSGANISAQVRCCSGRVLRAPERVCARASAGADRAAIVRPTGRPQDKYGDTPLHDACGNSNLELVQLLLKHGADPSIKNEKGQTPKDCVQGKHAEAILKLLP